MRIEQIEVHLGENKLSMLNNVATKDKIVRSYKCENWKIWKSRGCTHVYRLSLNNLIANEDCRLYSLCILCFKGGP